MQKTNLTPIVLVAALCWACGPRVADIELETEATETMSEAVQGTLDVSEIPERGWRNEPIGAVRHAGCDGAVEVLETATACTRDYPSHARVAWSCERPDGRSVSGNAEIRTTITPDACPPTRVDVEQDVDFARIRNWDGREHRIDGTTRAVYSADADARAAEKAVEVNVEGRRTHDGDVRSHRRVQGNKTVRIERGDTPEDDLRRVDGTLGVDFLIRGARLDVVKDGLEFRRSCCHPTGGRIDFARSYEGQTRERSITFGPSCGEATVDGDALDLRPCPVLE